MTMQVDTALTGRIWARDDLPGITWIDGVDLTGDVVRVVGRRRISRERVASTSMDRQASYQQEWCDKATQETGRRHVIVAWADDINVSGSVDPFKAKGLAPFLTDDAANFWDVLACWKIDRLSRTTINSYKLLGWCKERGKRIKATHDLIDPDSRVGELLWFIISWLGEGELEAIKDRTAGTRAWLIQTDRWPGGSIPFGYVQVKHKKEGWTLIPDPGMVAILEMIITWVIEKDLTATKVAETLNKLGIPGPYKGRGYKSRNKGNNPLALDGQWSTTAVLRICRSKNLLGIRTKDNGKGVKEVVLHKETGLPVQFGEPLISHSRYVELQEALDAKSRPRTKGPKEAEEEDGSSLPEVAMCAVCGRRMYRHFAGTGKRRTQYFECSGRRGTNRIKGVEPCRSRMVKKDEAWGHLVTYLMHEIGDKPWKRQVRVVGMDYTAEINQATESMTLLLEKVSTVKSTAAIAVFNNQIAALDERIEKLSALPTTKGGYTEEETGLTFREHWESLTEDEQVILLKKNGCHINILRWSGELTSPEARPDLPVIDFGGVKYALIPGKDRSHRPGAFHVVLGGQLERMLQAA